MLDIDSSILARVARQAQQRVAATQPFWAALIGQAARTLLRNRQRIEALEDGSLCIAFTRTRCIATPDTCTCSQFRRYRTCDHRLLAELYSRYGEVLAAQPACGAAD